MLTGVISKRNGHRHSVTLLRFLHFSNGPDAARTGHCIGWFVSNIPCCAHQSEVHVFDSVPGFTIKILNIVNIVLSDKKLWKINGNIL